MENIEDISSIFNVLNNLGDLQITTSSDGTFVEIIVHSAMLNFALFRYLIEADMLYIADFINQKDISIFDFSKFTDSAYLFQQSTVLDYLSFSSDEVQEMMDRLNKII